MLVFPLKNLNTKSSSSFFTPDRKKKEDFPNPHCSSDSFSTAQRFLYKDASESRKIPHNKFVGYILKQLNTLLFPENSLMFMHWTGRLNSGDLTRLAIDAAGKIPKADLDYCIEQKVPLTEVDTQEVLDIRQRNKNSKPIEKADDLFSKNHESILAHEMELLEQVPQDRKMLIITGLSGAGKSTYLDSINGNEYYVADIDDVKKLFPEYETRKVDNTLHNVSRSIMQEEIIPEAIRQGRNIAIPTTGLSEYVVRLATPAKENGYQVKLVHIKIDKQTAMQRVMDRFQKEGRFIDPYFIATRAPYMDSELVSFENPELVDEVEIIEN